MWELCYLGVEFSPGLIQTEEADFRISGGVWKHPLGSSYSVCNPESSTLSPRNFLKM